MRSRDEPTALTRLIGPLAMLAATGIVLDLLPRDLLVFIAIWTLASFPIGVLVGHCIAKREMTRSGQ